MNGSPLVGRHFGTLLVTTLLPDRKVRVHCSACGKEKTVDKRGLYRMKSCGCLRSKLISLGKTKHGHKTASYRSPEYVAYIGMHARCDNPKNPESKNYRQRGIRVCRHWSGKNGFVQFLADTGLKLDPAYSIDRINNDRGYLCPRCAGRQQCRWASAQTQRLNQRRVLEAA
jgi:hypothetical protein